jgi:uncharacterized membrane protein YphA (DoxX/SURF4 family)
MVVSTSRRTKGFQRMTDLTDRLKALEWLPILLIRLMEGIVFVDSGRHKLFADLAGFGTFFVELGMPFPSVMAVAVASREFGGGLCLVLGLGTRVAAFAEAGIMANAIWTVPLKDVKSFSEFLFLSEVPIYRYFCVARLHRRGHHKPRSLVGTHTQRPSPAPMRRRPPCTSVPSCPPSVSRRAKACRSPSSACVLVRCMSTTESTVCLWVPMDPVSGTERHRHVRQAV